MNPKFTPDMITPKLLKACERQVQKYFGQRKMTVGCEICKVIPRSSETSYKYDCTQCPLGDGESLDSPCTKGKNFIFPLSREHASEKRLLARGYSLIKIFDEHGISIIDK